MAATMKRIMSDAFCVPQINYPFLYILFFCNVHMHKFAFNRSLHAVNKDPKTKKRSLLNLLLVKIELTFFCVFLTTDTVPQFLLKLRWVLS